ncbi:MAG: flagellar protein FlaG [Clostridium sp.]
MEIKGSSQMGQSSGEVYSAPQVKQVDIESVQPVTSKDKGYKEEDVAKAVDKLNKFLTGDNLEATYEKHEVFGDIMIKIVNTNTKEVVLEVPPKKILDLVAQLCKMVGVIVDDKA